MCSVKGETRRTEHPSNPSCSFVSYSKRLVSLTVKVVPVMIHTHIQLCVHMHTHKESQPKLGCPAW